MAKMTQAQYAKSLRSSIVIVIKKNYPGEEYRELLQDWGYHRRLSQISDIDLLIEIKNVADGIPVNNAGIGKLDAQGKYLLVQMRKAGWNIKRLRSLLIKTTGKTKWLTLTQPQQRQIIKIVKDYKLNNSEGEESNAKE